MVFERLPWFQAEKMSWAGGRDQKEGGYNSQGGRYWLRPGLHVEDGGMQRDVNDFLGGTVDRTGRLIASGAEREGKVKAS